MITEAPVVTLTSPADHPYYMAGRHYQFKCAVTGFPRPSVYWQWQVCNTVACTPDPEGWNVLTDSRNQPNVNDVSVK